MGQCSRKLAFGFQLVGRSDELAYPVHDRDVLVTACGRICMYRKQVNISTVLAGQRLALQLQFEMSASRLGLMCSSPQRP